VWQPYGHVDQRGAAIEACFYVLDPIGAPTFAVDARGKVVWDAERTTFGDTRVTVNDVPVTARFPNQWYDEDVGLTYNRMRWYEPRLGMFVSPDPLLLQGNLNPRDYAPNPLMFIDPMGETTGSPTGGGGGCPPFGSIPGNTQPSTGKPWPDAVPPGPNFNPGTAATPGYVNCPPGLLNATAFGQKKFADPTTGLTVQKQIDNAGAAYGCHTCKTKNGNGEGADPSSSHFTADHQPPAGTYNNGQDRGSKPLPAGSQPSPGSVRLLPQCRKCSNSQGGTMSHMSDSDKAELAKQVMAYNNNPATQTPKP